MAAQKTFNQVIEVFKYIADNHGFINSWGFGEFDEIDVTKTTYPLMFVVPQASTFDKVKLKLAFSIIVMDLPHSNETNTQDILSDTLQTCIDIKAYLGQNPCNNFYVENGATITPFNEKQDNSASGWVLNCELVILNPETLCDIPGITPCSPSNTLISSISGIITTNNNDCCKEFVAGDGIEITDVNNVVTITNTLSGGTGCSTFICLSDTPSTYTDSAFLVPQVNSAENALEFVNIFASTPILALAATVGALPACTYDNATSGIGATLTGNSNGALPTIDTVTAAAGRRYLIKNQASKKENGVYELTQVGDGSLPFILTRTNDSDETSEFFPQIVFVTNLTGVNKKKYFTQTVIDPVVGTNNINYAASGIGGQPPTIEYYWSASTGNQSLIRNNNTGNYGQGIYSFINGKGNQVTNSGSASYATDYATILGGVNNLVTGTYNSYQQAKFSTILGGNTNRVSESYQLIGNGNLNNIQYGFFNSILNGLNNRMNSASFSTILGGNGNNVNAAASFIGTAVDSNVFSQYSAIITGTFNTIVGASKYSIIGSGRNNTITNSPYSLIVNGRDNRIDNVSNSAIIAISNVTATASNTLYTDLINARSLSGATTQMVVASSGGTLNTKGFISASFSQSVVATTVLTVTFGGTQPNTNYEVQVTPTNVLSAALFYITNKTTTTFDVTYLAGLTGTVQFDYLLIN